MATRSAPASRSGSKTSVGSKSSTASKPRLDPNANRTMSHQRFDAMKVTDAFGCDSKNGADLPCHVQHGSCRNEIQWDISPEDLQTRVWPLLIVAAGGLQQRTHPHAIKSRNGFADLCTFIKEIDTPSLRQVTTHLRTALVSGWAKADKTFDVFFATLDALVRLSDALQSNLNSYLAALLAPLAKAAGAGNKQVKLKVNETLGQIYTNGGDEALKIIRSKLPTF